MPLYSYECKPCGHQFETLVRTGDAPECPTCGSSELIQLLSLIASPAKGGEADAPSCATPGGCGSCPAFAG